MTLREWGRHLAQLRKARYPNAGEFAAAVNVSKRTVENWETGKHWPGVEHMAQIVRVLGPDADPGSVAQLSRIEAKIDKLLSSAQLNDLAGRISESVVRELEVRRRLSDSGKDAGEQAS